MIYFITGNENKFSEAKSIMPEIERLNMDLPEIQSIDPHEIIKVKLDEASRHHEGEFIVEDVSLCLECLNGLPGPLIKWFEKTVGLEWLADVSEKYKNNKAFTRVIIGYKSLKGIQYFESILNGQIVRPRGDKDFGWGPIFQPEGHDKTFGEMEREEKNSMSMRKMAFEKLKEHISK